LSLLVSLWGFAAAAIARRGYGPLLIGLAAAFALVIGKFFLYSNTLWIGEFGVWGATEQLWNAFHNCSVAPQTPNSPEKESREKLRRFLEREGY